jgi:hypothetical protein
MTRVDAAVTNPTNPYMFRSNLAAASGTGSGPTGPFDCPHFVSTMANITMCVVGVGVLLLCRTGPAATPINPYARPTAPPSAYSYSGGYVPPSLPQLHSQFSAQMGAVRTGYPAPVGSGAPVNPYAGFAGQYPSYGGGLPGMRFGGASQYSPLPPSGYTGAPAPAPEAFPTRKPADITYG